MAPQKVLFALVMVFLLALANGSPEAEPGYRSYGYGHGGGYGHRSYGYGHGGGGYGHNSYGYGHRSYGYGYGGYH
ncbi:keratin-associated protein 19-2-like [Penaeus indicus]|uniref:keratin-associated protein 19-2-like n=1 Tax=Penaeus indicus TaxID=29960 RepID=UPI00300C6761